VRCSRRGHQYGNTQSSLRLSCGMARCYLYKIACVAVCVAVCCGMARCYLYSAEKDLKGAEDAKILLESV